jgi:hypothetical protein
MVSYQVQPFWIPNANKFLRKMLLNTLATSKRPFEF